MNVIGERLTILRSSDPSKEGRSGTVLMDTAKMLVFNSEGRTLRVEKRGNVFQFSGTGRLVLESDISGRLEDRWGASSR